MTSLVFVPADEVIDVWMNVIEPFMAKNQDEISEEMDNFIDYFVETYLGKVGRSGRRGNPRIKIPTWNKFASVLEKVPCTNNGAEAFNGAWNKCTPTNASLWCICDGFLREEGLVHQKVHDARVNVVDPLAPGSARKQYSKNKEMLIFNLVSQYAQIPDKQNYLQEVGGIMKL